MKVVYGSRIETGDFSRVELKFADGTVLQLDFNTVLTLPQDSRSKSRPNVVGLEGGRLYASVTHLPSAERFQVRTPVATAEVLGTVFGLELQKPALPAGEIRALLQVKEGRVRFSNEFGIVTLGSEFESTAMRGAAPSEPQRIRDLRWQYLLSRDDDTAKTVSVVSFATKSLDQLEAAYAADGDFGWNGLTVEADSRGGRLRISEVVPGSPADRAGLLPNDLILMVDGMPMSQKWEFDRYVLRNPHKTLAIQLERMGALKDIFLGNDHSAGSNFPVDRKIESRLWELTWLGIDGRRAEAKKLLQVEATRLKSGSFFNNLGVLHEMDEDLGQAIRAYQNAVRIAPDHSRYRLNLALSLQKIANHVRAAEELEHHVKLSGWYEFGAEQLAKAQALAGKDDLALATLKTALEKLPSNAVLWLDLSDTLRSLSRIEEAADAAKKATDLRPNLDRAWIKLGDVLGQLGKYPESEAAYERALEINRTSIQAIHGIGLIRLRQGKLDEAEALGKRGVEIAPESAPSRVFLGNCYRVQGKLVLARSEFEAAIGIDPANATAHFNLALVLSLSREYVLAERHYKTVIRLAPSLWSAFSALGKMYTDLGRFDESDRMLREAIRLSPNNSALHNSLGWNLRKKGDFAGAEPEYRRALELDPGNALAYMNLGVLIGNLMGRLHEAEAVYRAFFKNLPNNPYASNGLAYNLAERGIKLDEALALSRKAVQIAPNDPDVVDTLGFILLLREELDEVESILRRAISLYGKSPSAAGGWVHLGMYYEKIGDRSKALEAFRSALAANPESTRARDSLRRIGG